MTLTIDVDTPPLRVDNNNVVRVGNTRVTLDTVIGAFLDGASAESIAEAYPVLSLADIYATIAYYLRHKPQIDAYLQENERRANAVRAEIESRPDYKLRIERLLARAKEKGLR